MFRHWRLVCAAALAAAVALPAAAARYAVRRDDRVVRLQDGQRDTSVSVLTAVGNIAFEMRVKGHNIFHWPYESIAQFEATPGLAGNPLLAPFANRLDGPAFYANGRRYLLDMELGNVRAPIPIHGFVQFTDRWKVIDAVADETSARVTARLEFFRYPDWMQQWPFAHAIEMTYALDDGVLEVRTKLTNMAAEPMPVSIGFHPYFTLTDSTRDDWTVSIGAARRWLLDDRRIPDGRTERIEQLLPDRLAVPLRAHNLDDVFGDLVRDSRGRAVASVAGRSQRVDVIVGPNYRSLVVYAPRGRNFICFEPMAGITNALNLAQKGLYHELQSVAPGGTWEESFWVRPSGF